MPYIFSGYGDFGLFILRVAVAAVFIHHAMPKLRNPRGMGQMMGMPGGAVLLVGVAEVAGALGLLAGILIEIAALFLVIIMVGAIMTKIQKWSIPFAAHDKTGWEFDLVLLAANLAILLTGGGSFALGL